MTNARSFRYRCARGVGGTRLRDQPAGRLEATGTPRAIVTLLWDQLAITVGLEPWNGYPVAELDEALRSLARHDVRELKDGLLAYLAPASAAATADGGSHAYCRHRAEPAVEPDGRRSRSPLGWAVFVDRRREDPR